MKNRRLIVNIGVINAGDNVNRRQNANRNFVKRLHLLLTEFFEPRKSEDFNIPNMRPVTGDRTKAK